MIQWISTNQSWVFSGIGVTVLVGLVAFGRYIWILAQDRLLGPPLPADRRRSAEKLLLGRWVGETVETQRASGTLSTYSVTWHFYKRGRRILCDSPATSTIDGNTQVDDYHLIVKILDNRFFMIEFCNKSDNSLNFGSEILELHDNGKEFHGRFVAYAPDHKDIITGTIKGRRA